MKTVVRYKVFETNSSSSHALCVCTPEEYEKFLNGELMLHVDSATLIPTASDDEYESMLIKYEYGPDEVLNFTSPSGDEMVAFCYEYYY